MKNKLVVKNLYKIFGAEPDAALKLLNQGVDKSEIFSRTGQTVGVCNANFEVREGEIFVVMGLSGSGKSTLVRLLNRLIEPSAGNILVDDEDIIAMNDEALLNVRRTKMSMVFQSFALMPHLNVVQNTAFGLELSGVPQGERESRAMVALEKVGLNAYANSYPDELSGGMQQRVGLARALANDPHILLMDEAFSALDPLIRTEMQDQLLQLQENDKRTIIFISHDLDEAMRIGDRIAIMEGGRVVQVGTPEEILNNPADDYVKSFFRGVDVTSVLSAGDIARKTQVTLIEREGMGVRSALQRLKEHDRDFGYVVGPDRKFHGVVSVDSLRASSQAEAQKITSAYLSEVEPVTSNVSLGDLIGSVAQAPCALPVVDADGRYAGVINKATLLEALDRSNANGHSRA
ncbi:ABC-type proline/glycine betaine transport system, ATPase component [Hahella chejuensis KCTC 2396]|uniref:Quaternary amine transport ATP-binding protein n=1 Tax=Hahella chejuensis (strain KCTC 2396) TaxID=349521 RepID=Q2SM99_HAHCH|nr:glycine betaine/L-proline ABC transporter ATP-binding protein ProV [Hahella chejuensis]ABC28225.1 ABC-type proline/glycine betaine transport system, ATPase component [Hahella chejuensis KCTC 2396]